MVRIHRDTQRLQLAHQPLGGHGVAQEEVGGVLVVHEVAHGVGVGEGSPLLHRLAVVGGVLHHGDPVGPELVLLPLPGVGGHVDDDPEAHRRAGDADAQAQIPRGAHLDGILGEKGPGLRGGQLAVVIVIAREEPVGQGQILGVLEDLIDAAPGLDGPRHRQVAVLLEEEGAGQARAVPGVEPVFQGGHRTEGGLDDPVGRGQLGKTVHQEGGEPGQPGLGVVDVRHGQGGQAMTLGGGLEERVAPEKLPFLLQGLELGDGLFQVAQGLCCHGDHLVVL